MLKAGSARWRPACSLGREGEVLPPTVGVLSGGPSGEQGDVQAPLLDEQGVGRGASEG